MELLSRIRAATARARESGAMSPLSAEVHEIREAGVPFVVRAISRFVHKPHGDRAADPFAPPWTDVLFVEERPPAHALLLNKFPVLPDHLLLVTRAWADQEEPLDPADWDAWDALFAELDGLGFYNGGREAGASQPHRHLQLVGRDAVGVAPLEPAIEAARGSDRVPGWPFPHRVGPPTYAAYRDALRAFAPGPHTLLRTRAWQLLVPRSVGEVEGIPVNALAYAGLLAAKSGDQLERIRERGPFWVLTEAARRG